MGERNVIDLARAIAYGSTTKGAVSARELKAICASLIAHHEALEPFTDMRVAEVSDYRRAASVHTKAQEPL